MNYESGSHPYTCNYLNVLLSRGEVDSYLVYITREEIMKWLLEKLNKDYYTLTYGKVHFKQATDLLAFRLRWGF